MARLVQAHCQGCLEIPSSGVARHAASRHRQPFSQPSEEKARPSTHSSGRLTPPRDCLVVSLLAMTATIGTGVCRGRSPLEGVTRLQNPPESPFAKGGLRGLKGLRATPFGTGFPLPRIREDRPRFHEDKLRGNDPPEADRGLGACFTLTPGSSPGQAFVLSRPGERDRRPPLAGVGHSMLCLLRGTGVCRGAKPLEGVTPVSNSLESPFAKGGLRGIGIKGVERAPCNALWYWIPAPRLHEDKPHGNDPPEADRGSGCPLCFELPGIPL
jgi:hypothetical protein